MVRSDSSDVFLPKNVNELVLAADIHALMYSCSLVCWDKRSPGELKPRSLCTKSETVTTGPANYIYYSIADPCIYSLTHY